MSKTDEIMAMGHGEMRARIIGQDVMLSAVSQLVWRSLVSITDQGQDVPKDLVNAARLLRPYHPDRGRLRTQEDE